MQAFLWLFFHLVAFLPTSCEKRCAKAKIWVPTLSLGDSIVVTFNAEKV